MHDDQHSFRVAERMASLADFSFLTDFELAQLLLSAYLHDIGMSPRRENVQAHYNYLCTADDKLLNPIERKEVQNWLDENWPKLNLPLSGLNTVSGIKLADEVCAYYCRSRHNDWSEDWIQDNLKSITPGLYPGWIDDLSMLCKSHHEGYSELCESRFDARLVGSPAASVNIRFLAAILRLADVLEFDPERTPPVILQHRGIVPKSRVFWHQDQGIAFKFSDDRSKLIFSARTPDARIHKAVLSVADYVDAELTCCHNLNQQGAFAQGVISDTERRAYIWQLPANLTLDVKEKDDSFTYIEGTFRPDVPRLLELLSGTQLYNDPRAAVRELIQNAADAISELIGHERLRQDDADNPEHEKTFASLHKIRLTFEREGERLWLRCADDGVGLNKSQIERRLLRSGANERPEFKALEREARAKGFSVFRTGQFGIGLLSYFMIADRVEFDTKRSEEAGDGGGNAWTFVTEGIASFGELKRSSRDRHGTEVRLRLRDDLIPPGPGEDDKWFTGLERYLRMTIRHLPCRFELRNNLKSAPIQWSTGPRWTTEAATFAPDLIADLKEESKRAELLPLDEQERLDRVESRWSELKASAFERLRWFGPVEHTGTYFRARHWVPYFELNGGASLVYIDFVDNCINRTPDNRDGLSPRAQTYFSWKGFQAQGHAFQSAEIGIMEVDIFSDADISINRNAISKLNRERLVNELRKVERDTINKFLAAHRASTFHILNKRIAGKTSKYATPVTPGSFHWKVDREWKQISYPFAVVSAASFEHDQPTWTEATLLDATMPIIKRFSLRTGDDVEPAAAFGGARLCAVQVNYGVRPAGVFLEPPAGRNLLWTSQFPPEWNQLLFVSTTEMHFWNNTHPLVQKLNRHPDTLPHGRTREDRFLECLTSEVLAARFLFAEMPRGFRMLKALRDSRPSEFLQFIRLLEADTMPIYWQTFESIFSDDTRTFMISGTNIIDMPRPFSDKGHLILPDGVVLAKPNREFQLTPVDRAHLERYLNGAAEADG
ncbi:hypothetical protein ACNJYA_09760 [Bradyrhizobium sp. DASA03068]|uniref:HD domain-containing protein n=1 Tax=Bradyrhizobium sp. BLXBL-01 TaxID=3395915 RepID=UPI003F713D2F